MSHFTVVYDACVLYPAPLRDLLMHLALTDLFRAKWSNTIHEEWIRSVLRSRPDLTLEQLQRTRALMDAHVLDCLVSDYEELIPTLDLPDTNDRHVLAVAIRAQAKVIVTYNLADFPENELAKFGIKAEHPDTFIVHLIDVAPDRVFAAVKRQRQNLKRPSMTIDELLDRLQQQALPQTVARLRPYGDLL